MATKTKTETVRTSNGAKVTLRRTILNTHGSQVPALDETRTHDQILRPPAVPKVHRGGTQPASRQDR